MLRKLTAFTILMVFFSALSGERSIALAQSSPRPVPNEVRALTGTFTGSWTSFGIDEKGQVVKRAAWTDTVKAENPLVKDDRAYVTTTDEMVFAGGRIPPMSVQGTEGYFLKNDLSLGDYFVAYFGQTYRVRNFGKDTWVYATPADPRELAQLGFSNVAFGEHVIVKVVTYPDGVETHRISRVTTVNWKDADGMDRWIQYVSLQGVHQRKSP